MEKKCYIHCIVNVLIICIIYSYICPYIVPNTTAGHDYHALRAKSTKQSSAGRALRDNMFSQLPEGSRRWVAAERNQSPALSFHYTVRAWQRQAFGDADKYLTQMIGEEQDDLHKTSSAGDVKRYREEWNKLRSGDITEEAFLRNVDIYELSKVSEYITADPREAAILHHYIYSNLPSYYDDLRRLERRKMYKALLRPEAGRPDALERFMSIFNKEHPRSLIFQQEKTPTAIETKGILHKKDPLMLVLIYSASQDSFVNFIDNTVLKWQHGSQAHFGKEDKYIIARLGKIRPNTRKMGALNRLVKEGRIYVPDAAIFGNDNKGGLIRWMARGIYPVNNTDVIPATQLDLFEYNKVRRLIDVAA